MSTSEKKIDLLVHRLGGIEQALHELKSGNNSGATPSVRANTTPADFTPSNVESYPAASARAPSGPSEIVGQQDPGPAFEGLSSLSAQSAYASEFLESAMSRGGTLSEESSPKIAAALSTLKHIVRMQSLGPQHSVQEVRFPSQKAASPGSAQTAADDGLKNLKMPPMEAVIALLHRIKGELDCVRR